MIMQIDHEIVVALVRRLAAAEARFEGRPIEFPAKVEITDFDLSRQPGAHVEISHTFRPRVTEIIARTARDPNVRPVRVDIVQPAIAKRSVVAGQLVDADDVVMLRDLKDVSPGSDEA